jgi:hypothetical protein
MYKKLLLVTGTTAFACAQTMAAPIMMFAKLDSTNSSATHKLLPATDAAKAPHPFYTKYCKGKAARSYKHAAGYALLQYYPKMNRVKFAIAYEGISGQAIMAHFHIGKANVMGPIVQTICGNPPPGNKKLGFSAGPAIAGKYCPKGDAGFITGSFALKANKKVKSADSLKKVRDALLGGMLYINFHTCLNQPGEIRGQIVSYHP